MRWTARCGSCRCWPGRLSGARMITANAPTNFYAALGVPLAVIADLRAPTQGRRVPSVLEPHRHRDSAHIDVQVLLDNSDTKGTDHQAPRSCERPDHAAVHPTYASPLTSSSTGTRTHSKGCDAARSAPPRSWSTDTELNVPLNDNPSGRREAECRRRERQRVQPRAGFVRTDPGTFYVMHRTVPRLAVH